MIATYALILIVCAISFAVGAGVMSLAMPLIQPLIHSIAPSRQFSDMVLAAIIGGYIVSTSTAKK